MFYEPHPKTSIQDILQIRNIAAESSETANFSDFEFSETCGELKN